MGEKCYNNRADHVFDVLKQEILSLELKPGQSISENEICTRFHVSRTPVREALRRLQEQGFVCTVPYSGTTVSLLNLDDIRQMIYMRVAVELMVMRDFMETATTLQYEEIRHQIRLQELLIQEPEQIEKLLPVMWYGNQTYYNGLFPETDLEIRLNIREPDNSSWTYQATIRADQVPSFVWEELGVEPETDPAAYAFD